jgi:hypothetical protein
VDDTPQQELPQVWQTLDATDVANGIEAQLAPANLILPPIHSTNLQGAPDRRFSSNELFWSEVLSGRLRANTVVTLEDFFLFEWYPRSPGLFHTERARDVRADAQFHLLRLTERERRIYEDTRPPDPVVYSLYGKSLMLEGGLGCIRLLPKNTETGPRRFVSASSNFSAHEGVPVAISETDYAKYIDYIANYGVLPCNLMGRLKFLPEPLLSLTVSYYVGVPRMYLSVDEVRPARTSVDVQEKRPLVSVAVMFESTIRGSVSAAYISFIPGASSSMSERLRWLDYYVTEMHEGRVVTDFDEQVTHFSGAAFSLHKICNGLLRGAEIAPIINNYLYMQNSVIRNLISGQSQLAEIRINSERFTVSGDMFSNIGAGATIVNRSTLINSMNALSQKSDEDTANALRELAQAIQDAGNEAAAENFDAFMIELQRPEPRKSLLKSLWAGVVEALPSIVTLADAVSKIASLFS